MSPEESNALDALYQRDSQDEWFAGTEPVHRALDDLGAAQEGHAANLADIRNLLFGVD